MVVEACNSSQKLREGSGSQDQHQLDYTARLSLFRIYLEPGVVADTFSLNTQEVEADGTL